MSRTKQNSPVESLDQWVSAGFHTVMCPSGIRVGIRIPDLAALIEGGELPQHLLDAALMAAGQRGPAEDKEIDVEDIKREREFTNFLVSTTVVKPEITPEQAATLPVEDREMIAAIALRMRVFDAEGSHIGGLDSSEKFRRFHKLGEFESPLEGL